MRSTTASSGSTPADALPFASLADKLHNLRSLLIDLELHGPSVWDRFHAGRDDQLWYYAQLAQAARTHHPGGRLAHELVASVERLRQPAA